MLCSALSQSGVAGQPEEFFSLSARQRYAARHRMWTPDTLLDDVQWKRTTPNGVFGIKIHAADFVDMFGKDRIHEAGASFLGRFDRLVLCWRRSKIDQAISNILATERGLWTHRGPEHPEFPARSFRPADIEDISLEIARMAGQERFWREYVGHHSQAMLEVAYEDLATAPDATVARVLAFLDIRLPEGTRPRPTTQRLANKTNEQLKAAYLAAIGGASAIGTGDRPGFVR